MSDCGYNGDAYVQRNTETNELSWLQADERVHVSDEVKDHKFLTDKYAVGEWCPELNAYHARLR